MREPRILFIWPLPRAAGSPAIGEACTFHGRANDYIARCSPPFRISSLTDRFPPFRMTDDPPGRDGDAGVAVKTQPKTQRPPLYKVLLLNDDFTPMEFVVHILERLFGMTHAQAIEIMLTVHRKGVAVVGVFSHEIAETKVAQVMELARRQQHPLQCTMEKE